MVAYVQWTEPTASGLRPSSSNSRSEIISRSNVKRRACMPVQAAPDASLITAKNRNKLGPVVLRNKRELNHIHVSGAFVQLSCMVTGREGKTKRARNPLLPSLRTVPHKPLAGQAVAVAVAMAAAVVVAFNISTTVLHSHSVCPTQGPVSPQAKTLPPGIHVTLKPQYPMPSSVPVGVAVGVAVHMAMAVVSNLTRTVIHPHAFPPASGLVGPQA
eukprot:gene20260-27014_t